jgi:3-hydroxyisobutyrate dehydrogenase
MIADCEAVGFVGLGDIGAPMAERLAQAGYALHVWNRTAAKVRALAGPRVRVAETASALARYCRIVFICVTDAAAVEYVVFGPQGLAEEMGEDHLLVDCSTIGPKPTRDMAQRLAQHCGAGWVDAPVSGGAAGARAGTLAAMVGGTDAEVERVRPCLAAFASNITHMGPVGSGAATKACNQILSYCAGAAVAEALNLAAAFGLDPARLPAALAGGFGDSRVLQHYGPKMAEGTCSGNSLISLKDLDIALEMARTSGRPVPLTALTASLFRLAIAQGHTSTGLATPVRLYAQGPIPVQSSTR